MVRRPPPHSTSNGSPARSEPGAKLRLARWLARVLYCRLRFAGWVFRRFGQQLAEAMTDIVTGEQLYRTTVKRTLRFWRGRFDRLPSEAQNPL